MSGDDPAQALARLDEITRTLRVECPWDREQDERTIVPHTVEEAYELADAAAQGDDEKIKDELGDVLFQVVFLSLLLEERGAGSLAAVADEVSEKLIRRHPHVYLGRGSGTTGRLESESEPSTPKVPDPSYGDQTANAQGAKPTTAKEVLRNWDQIKRDVEGRGKDDPFADVPENLPGLLYARKILRRADPEGGTPSPKGPARDHAEGWVGEVLLEVVRISRRLGVDPELALRQAADRLKREHAK